MLAGGHDEPLFLGVGARVRRSIGTAMLRNFDPFLMLDEFMVTPHEVTAVPQALGLAPLARAEAWTSRASPPTATMSATMSAFGSLGSEALVKKFRSRPTA